MVGGSSRTGRWPAVEAQADVEVRRGALSLAKPVGYIDRDLFNQVWFTRAGQPVDVAGEVPYA
jgi:hypothetical protein